MIIMAQKTTGSSLDLIIHPGETLLEILNDRNMTQKDLATRTSFTEKHISNIIRGKNNISAKFAKALEYALGIDASFWLNLQTNYDIELEDFKSLNNISEEEIAIGKKLKSVLYAFRNLIYIDENMSIENIIVYLRKLLGVSNLVNIINLTFSASFRIKNSQHIDDYILYTWIKLCELSAQNQTTENTLDITKLEAILPQVREIMSIADINLALKQLTDILSQCGIIFKVVQNVPGAPVQGFIKKRDDDRAILFLTIRGSYADIFWFSLFHEIAHILNDDIGKNTFLDYQDQDDEKELLADKLAANLIINEKDYNDFIKHKITIYEIDKFARCQNIPIWMVIGRLQKEKIIPYSYYAQAKARYEWAK